MLQPFKMFPLPWPRSCITSTWSMTWLVSSWHDWFDRGSIWQGKLFCLQGNYFVYASDLYGLCSQRQALRWSQIHHSYERSSIKQLVFHPYSRMLLTFLSNIIHFLTDRISVILTWLIWPWKDKKWKGVRPLSHYTIRARPDLLRLKSDTQTKT